MSKFEDVSAAPSQSFVSDVLYFVRHHKKWWLLPPMVILLLLGVMMLLGGTGAAPFIYTLF